MKSIAITYDMAWWRRLWIMIFTAAAVLILAGCDMGGAIIYGELDTGDDVDTGGLITIAEIASFGTFGFGNSGITVGLSEPVEDEEDQQQVEDSIEIIDENGYNFAVPKISWQTPVPSSLTFYGPYKACVPYTVQHTDADGNVTQQQVPMFQNPTDLDGGAGCTSDYVFQLGGDKAALVIVNGEIISNAYRAAWPVPVPALLDGLWHFKIEKGDEYDSPSLLFNGAADGRTLMVSHGIYTTIIGEGRGDPVEVRELFMWGSHDRTDPDPDRSILYSGLPEGCEFESFLDAGDVNRDGNGDFVLNFDCTTREGLVYPYSLLILGSVPEVMGMQALALASAEGQEAIGAAADLDGDGYSDLAAISTEMGSDERGLEVVESSEIRIFSGSSNVSSIFDEPGAVIAMALPDRAWTGMAAADVNGDGVRDLIAVSHYYGNTKETSKTDPKVHVFLGGSGVSGDMTEADAAFVISDGLDYKAVASVHRVGDMRGAGYEGFAVGYSIDIGGVEMGSFMLFHGRESWREEYALQMDRDVAIRPDLNYLLTDVHSALVAGLDFNNDGIPDIVIQADDAEAVKRVHLVFMGGEFPGIMDLSDYDVKINAEDLKVEGGGDMF